LPHKFNAAHRDKIPKQKYCVTNWSEYNEGLRRRGDLTVWVCDGIDKLTGSILNRTKTYDKSQTIRGL
jgi:hypothetical protein